LLLSRPLGKLLELGGGARDQSYEWIKGRILLVGTLTQPGRPILPRANPGERRSHLLALLDHQKPVCSGGLLMGGRQGCSQQLQDRAIITPVDFGPSRSADPAQGAPRREKKPSFSPKAFMLWWSAGGRSPRLQPAIAGSSRHHPRRLWPVSAGQYCPECAQAREEASFNPFTPKAGKSWRSAGGRSPRLQPGIAG
jgi:hypothetical protein